MLVVLRLLASQHRWALPQFPLWLRTEGAIPFSQLGWAVLEVQGDCGDRAGRWCRAVLAPWLGRSCAITLKLAWGEAWSHSGPVLIPDGAGPEPLGI